MKACFFKIWNYFIPFLYSACLFSALGGGGGVKKKQTFRERVNVGTSKIKNNHMLTHPTGISIHKMNCILYSFAHSVSCYEPSVQHGRGPITPSSASFLM